MYDTKVLKKTGEKLVAYQSTWLVEDTIAVSELELCPRAVLKAPEGKFLTLTVNGVGRQIKPGTYKGGCGALRHRRLIIWSRAALIADEPVLAGR